MAFGTHKLTAKGAALSSAEERRFFGSLQLANGVWKNTRARRLDDVNALVAAKWQHLGFQPQFVMDAGASSGVSSSEWADALASDGFSGRVVATDLALFGKLITILPGTGILVDRHGTVLQHFAFGRFLVSKGASPRAAKFAELARSVIDRAARLRRINPAQHGRPVSLVNADAMAHPLVDFVEDDLLSPPPAEMTRRFDAIRVANVLNLSYFGIDDLKRAMTGLRQRLAGVGSFLIVVRTWAGGANHGTLFRLNANQRFEAVARWGSGSEIENLVLRSVG